MNSHHDPASDEPRPESEPTDPSEPHGPTLGEGNRDAHSAGPQWSPAGPGSRPAGQPPEPTAAQRFFAWLRGLGLQRGADRWIGGVASGIAHRVGIDPVIVRGLFLLFVIFGGIGILLYGLAWAFLPEPDGRIHAEGASRGSWSDGMTGALIITIVGLFRPFGGFWSGSWDFGSILWTLLWIGGLIAVAAWLFGSSRKKQQPMQAAWHQPPYGSPAAETDTRTVPAGTGTDAPLHPGPDSGPPPLYEHYPYGPEVPYRYQPDAVPPVKDAGRGHEPSKESKESSRAPGAAMVAISAGLAMLVGGGLLGLHYVQAIDLGPSANSLAAAAAAVVLGLSVAVAGIRGRTSGTIGFLAILALLLGGVLGLIPSSGNFVIGSNTTWEPRSAAAAERGYTAVMAQGNLELEPFDAQGPLSEEIVVPVQVAMGNMLVTVPEGVPVEVRSSLAFGSLNFEGDGTESSGIWNPSDQTLNADAPGERIVVELRGLFSQVTIAESDTEESGQ